MPGGFGDDPEVGGRYEYQGQVNPNDPSVANGQISPEQWAEYQKKRRRDAIFGLLGTFGGTVGLGFAGQALGGAGAAANAASSAGGLPPIAGGSPWAVTPYAGSMAPGAGAAGGAAAGGGMAAGGMAGLGGMNIKDLVSLGLAGAGTVGGLMQDPANMNPNTQTNDPNLQKLIATMQGRMDQSEPLYKSIMA